MSSLRPPGRSSTACWARSDLRAGQVDGMLTIVVAQQASAVTTGATKTQRTSTKNYQADGSAGQLGGDVRRYTAFGSGNHQPHASAGHHLDRRSHPRAAQWRAGGGGIQGHPNQLRAAGDFGSRRSPAGRLSTPTNRVQSDGLGQLDVRVNGKGVVGTGIRRPFFLYRFLLGLLPF